MASAAVWASALVLAMPEATSRSEGVEGNAGVLGPVGVEVGDRHWRWPTCQCPAGQR